MSDTNLEKLMEYVQKKRAEYAFLASNSNKRGMEAAKLAAECREIAYFDVMKAIERIQVGGQP